ncbi:FadR family transcriptional regulator [Salipiger sp. IMCC34102]|uniref:FadR/GntR family transcriptional regulator n=1 Tax=Salipiger sp. IMCC34102 TaxID=2510647 RepID=UPI00101C2107|nr:FadR/GntR family transcriptional regulator [Salipiger sp. IMCC34102]RYH01019.1 FadR family transcriptional regulator [Salipiger sp. IMCC34102]
MKKSGPRKLRLADTIVEQIRDDIASGRLSPDDRLPTEPQMMEQFSVSRTVIREAVAELRAEGLVRTVQGAGAFVTERRHGFRLTLTPDEASAIPRALEILEFRIGFEAEAAALAAVRHGPADEHEITVRHRQLCFLVEQGEPSAEADFKFHVAIAEAAHSPLYVQAIKNFGPEVIPRSHLPNQPQAQSKEYLASVLAEHEIISNAIGRGDPQVAHAAMREHLESSRLRYRKLARQAEDLSVDVSDKSYYE